jgi:hypothetical protein
VWMEIGGQGRSFRGPGLKPTLATAGLPSVSWDTGMVMMGGLESGDNFGQVT